jgi:putative spermidine/putrescine transport system permease protein
MPPPWGVRRAGHALRRALIVVVYLWLPFMILPIQAAIERIPGSYIAASGDLGAGPALTFMKVTLPLALPGIAAGSIVTSA